ncbi:MAG: hypothetical protein U1F87_11005 [Kiritimatiellia bacterium]
MAARVSVVTLLGLTPVYAVNYDFDNGGGTGDWNLNTNWAPDGLPSTTDNVFVNVTGAAVKTITLAATPVNSTINEVGLARTGDGTATVNHTGGTLTVQSWFNLGQGAAAAGNNGTGVWNMSGSSVVNATHSAGGQTVIGVGFTSSPDYSTGILTLSDNAQFLQTANDIRIGGEPGDLARHRFGDSQREFTAEQKRRGIPLYRSRRKRLHRYHGLEPTRPGDGRRQRYPRGQSGRLLRDAHPE